MRPCATVHLWPGSKKDSSSGLVIRTYILPVRQKMLSVTSLCECHLATSPGPSSTTRTSAFSVLIKTSSPTGIPFLSQKTKSGLSSKLQMQGSINERSIFAHKRVAHAKSCIERQVFVD